MKSNYIKFIFILSTLLLVVISLYNINIVTSEMSDENLYTNRFDNVVFTYIEPGGVSDLAGLRTNDILVAINGDSITSSLHAQEYLNRAKPGESLVYTIQRDGVLMDVKLDLAIAGLRIWHFGSIITGILFVVFSLFLIFSKPDNKHARLLSLAAIMLAIIFINLQISGYRVAQFPFYKFVVLLIINNMYFAIPVVAHASLHFPERKYETIKPFLMIYNHYIIAGIMAILASYVFLRYNFFNPLEALPGVIYLIIIELSFLRKRRKEYKARQKPFIISLGIILAGLLVSIIFSPESVNVGYFTFAIILLPLSYWYTTVRFRVYDVQLRWRLSLVYNFLQITFILAFSVFIFFLVRTIPLFELNLPVVIFSGNFIELYDIQSISPELQVQVRTGYQILLGIILAFLGFILLKTGRSFLDRVFFQQKYDYKIALKNFSDLLSSSFTRDDISKQSLDHIIKVMKLKGIMLAVPQNGSYVITNSVGSLSDMKSRKFDLTPVLRDRLLVSGEELRPGDVQQIHEIDQIADNIQCGIPVTSGNGKIEALLFTGEKLSESPYNNEDMELLSYFIEHLGLAFERVHLYEEMSDKARIKRELEIAREIQIRSLPKCEPEYSGLQICSSLSAANEVAGDYYDYLEIDENRLDVIVGDVTGKGTSAAFHMSKIQGFVQTLSAEKISAGLLLEKLNTLIRKSFDPEFFFTALYGMFDTKIKQLQIYRLGHNGLIYYNHNQKKCQVLEPEGMGLGLSETELFRKSLASMSVNYQPGDIFAFLTDGFLEAMNDQNIPFGEEKILRILEENPEKSASQIMDTLIREVSTYADNKRFDDSTGVIIKITG